MSGEPWADGPGGTRTAVPTNRLQGAIQPPVRGRGNAVPVAGPSAARGRPPAVRRPETPRPTLDDVEAAVLRARGGAAEMSARAQALTDSSLLAALQVQGVLVNFALRGEHKSPVAEELVAGAIGVVLGLLSGPAAPAATAFAEGVIGTAFTVVNEEVPVWAGAAAKSAVKGIAGGLGKVVAKRVSSVHVADFAKKSADLTPFTLTPVEIVGAAQRQRAGVQTLLETSLSLFEWKARTGMYPTKDHLDQAAAVFVVQHRPDATQPKDAKAPQERPPREPLVALAQDATLIQEAVIWAYYYGITGRDESVMYSPNNDKFRDGHWYVDVTPELRKYWQRRFRVFFIDDAYINLRYARLPRPYDSLDDKDKNLAIAGMLGKVGREFADQAYTTG